MWGESGNNPEIQLAITVLTILKAYNKVYYLSAYELIRSQI